VHAPGADLPQEELEESFGAGQVVVGARVPFREQGGGEAADGSLAAFEGEHERGSLACVRQGAAEGLMGQRRGPEVRIERRLASRSLQLLEGGRAQTRLSRGRI